MASTSALGPKPVVSTSITSTSGRSSIGRHHQATGAGWQGWPSLVTRRAVSVISGTGFGLQAVAAADRSRQRVRVPCPSPTFSGSSSLTLCHGLSPLPAGVRETACRGAGPARSRGAGRRFDVPGRQGNEPPGTRASFWFGNNHAAVGFGESGGVRTNNQAGLNLSWGVFTAVSITVPPPGGVSVAGAGAVRGRRRNWSTRGRRRSSTRGPTENVHYPWAGQV